MKELNILHVGGYSSTNIGNAFYNLGIQHVLRTVPKKINLYKTSDMQVYAWSRYNSQSSSCFDPCEHFADMDYIIWSGPMMGTQYVREWSRVLERAEMAGTKVICLSAGGNQYTKEEVEEVRKFLGKFHLYALFSRDTETYENYRDLFEYSYDGICCAFFIPEYFQSWELDMEPYVVFNFEQYKEPCFVEFEGGGGVNFRIKSGKERQENGICLVKDFLRRRDTQILHLTA